MKSKLSAGDTQHNVSPFLPTHWVLLSRASHCQGVRVLVFPFRRSPHLSVPHTYTERERESAQIFTEIGVFVVYDTLLSYQYLGNLTITTHTDASHSF